MQSALSGVLFLGSYEGIKQVRRGDGSAVDEMFELRVSEAPRYEDDDEPRTHRATFFASNKNGKSAIAQELEDLKLQKGERIGVTVGARAKDGFLNWSAFHVVRLEEPKAATRPVRAAS